VVSATALSKVAFEIGIGDFLLLGKGEDQTGGRTKPNLLADAFEAILGAAYVSKGLDAAESIIRKFVFPLLEDTDRLRAESDPKTTLQERTQAAKQPAPEYVTTHEGPDHDRIFFSVVSIDGVEAGRGQGRSKKLAETNAAIDALLKQK
jgi:ribonuclease-3